MVVAAGIAVEKAKALKVGTFDIPDLLLKLRHHLADDRWSGLGPVVKRICGLAPSSGFMYGGIRSEVKMRVVKKTAVMGVEGVASKPRKVWGD